MFHNSQNMGGGEANNVSQNFVFEMKKKKSKSAEGGRNNLDEFGTLPQKYLTPLSPTKGSDYFRTTS